MLKRKNRRPQNSLQQSSQELDLPVGEARRVLIDGREIYSMAKNSRPRKLSVYLYIPNIIGYIRVLMNCFAFYICFSDKKLFSVLYFVSFVCDALDGWFARKFNQVSTFGAVLDMITDRISTACLLVILSQIYRPGLVFLSLLALDIASHWLQMYSTFLVGKVSHKDVSDSTNWLFKAYYGNRIFMCYCCVACEVLYIILFLLAKNQNENLKNVIMDATKQNSVLSVLLVLLVVGWAIKQAVNVIQIKTAADACVDYDINKKQKP
ncbi:CDP-diacylglycerol--inositol 3-phosphatidyltransferase 1 [Camellia lanceoleosa]|uniref:CDP-diacylglycerol--inositol 3-phosphatidyltransferase 1 n=1 Tax=Camellia lanceoleosa TaxID=1840588 RepID=A0ACC0IFU3_9ERIC|nr:CDP-diacylglycerol--inositol 3-phosphatidyltransferase 1 [Camellia lanceoleosa]